MVLFDKPFSQPEYESRKRREDKEKQSRESKGSLDKSNKLPLKNPKSSKVKASK